MAVISQEPPVSEALFEILETQRLVDGAAKITLVNGGDRMLADLLVARSQDTA
jgi:hypothetical protein